MISSMPTASPCRRLAGRDRKSTRLNSSHLVISYAVFCLKKKKIDTLIAQFKFLTNRSTNASCYCIVIFFYRLFGTVAPKPRYSSTRLFDNGGNYAAYAYS